MYTDFFGLSAKPFELLPNPRFLYLSQAHRKALSYLQYGLQERIGFTLMTGEVGSGKTTLIRDMINKIPADMTLAMVFNTRVDGAELIALINEDFGLPADDRTKVQLLRDLNDFLLEECAQGRRPIIIIDEAQNLSEDSLEEIRLLSNLESTEQKLVQIVLVGQPELKELIARPSLRQLRQRISVSCHLKPLNLEETGEYIRHRLGTVGDPDCICLATGVLEEIHRFSSGIPRLINLLCDFLLLSAFVDETREITLDLVADAIQELSFEQADSSVADTVTGAQSANLNQRLETIEEKYLLLTADRKERETVLERLSSQGSILEYLINQQQGQFQKIEERLKSLSAQIDRLRQALLVQGQRAGFQEALLVEPRKENGR